MNQTLKKLAIACGLLGLAATTQADPAVYRDNVMTIDNGVLINGDTRNYYTDIVLTTEANGRLKIVSANQLPLVHIDDASTLVTETTTERSVSVSITGYKSVPCVSLEDAAVSYKDEVFTILLAETVMGPAESCIAIIAPFETDVALDVTDLEAGTYEVVVNGEATSFTLTSDPLIIAD